MSSRRASIAVAARFVEYVARITPRAGVRETMVLRSSQIQRALARTMPISRAIRVGSFYKRTAIRDRSDLDFFVVLRREAVRWGGEYTASTTVLRNIRAAIIDRYPTSDIGRDVSAVTVSFADGIAVDVVPAVFEGPIAGGYPMYLIPDGDGGWLETSPDRQRLVFSLADAASRGKLRASVQLVKAWARYREVPLPISSFYLETVLAQAGLTRGARSYSRILTESILALADRGERAVRDPLGISGYIHVAATEAQRGTVARSLRYASYHASAALKAEMEGDAVEAVRQWRTVLPGFLQ